MTQEKPTSLSVLQTQKKKKVIFTPVHYILMGFLAGVLSSTLLFFIFFKINTSDNASLVSPQVSTLPSVVEEADTEESAHAENPSAQTAHRSSATQQHSQEQEETTVDGEFVQPKDSELSGLFTRTPPAPKPQDSPFGHKPDATKPNTDAKTIKDAVPKPIDKNASPPDAKSTEKPASEKASKSAQKTVPEEELPKASVNIQVTQNPFSVNKS